MGVSHQESDFRAVGSAGEVHASAVIHPTAIIHSGAHVAAHVKIGPYCIVGEHVSLGEGTVLRSHVNIEGHTTIGKGNEFFPFSSIGAPPQDLKYKGENTRLVLGDENTVRESVTLQPGTVQGGGITTIGHKNLLMAYCHVAHDCILGNENILANGVQLSGHVTLENQTVLGGLSAVHQFCCIGDLAMLGGGSMVVQDVPPFALVQGDHAGFRALNLVGMKRKGYSKEQIALVKKAYQYLIFEQSPTVEESIQKLELSLSSEDDKALVEKIVLFMRKSTRGVIRRAE